MCPMGGTETKLHVGETLVVLFQVDVVSSLLNVFLIN